METETKREWFDKVTVLQIALETVKVRRRGTKIHLRYADYPTTLCGQGMSVNRITSPLYKVDEKTTCKICHVRENPPER